MTKKIFFEIFVDESGAAKSPNSTALQNDQICSIAIANFFANIWLHGGFQASCELLRTFRPHALFISFFQPVLCL
jgi:hypothetical protein